MFSTGNYAYIDNVKLTKCNDFLMPNVFTPNNDGVNDVIDFSDLIGGQVTIQNRWGIEVFKSSNSKKFWNGKDFSGNTLSEGVYFYLIQTEKDFKTGFIHLIR